MGYGTNEQNDQNYAPKFYPERKPEQKLSLVSSLKRPVYIYSIPKLILHNQAHV